MVLRHVDLRSQYPTHASRVFAVASRWFDVACGVWRAGAKTLGDEVAAVNHTCPLAGGSHEHELWQPSNRV